MKTIKRISTLLLAVMLIASFTIAAFADTDWCIVVETNSDGDAVSNSYTGNVNVTNNGATSAAYAVTYASNSSATLYIDGNASAENGDAVGARARTMNSNAEVSVTGDASSTGSYSQAVNAVCLTYATDSTATAHVEGGASASGKYAYGVNAYTTADGSTATVTVGKDVKAEGTDSIAVTANASYGAYTTVTVGGDVTAMNNGNVAVKAVTEGETSICEVEVKGNVIEKDDYSEGILAKAIRPETSTTVKVGKDVSAIEANSNGLDMMADGGTVNVEVGGSIKAGNLGVQANSINGGSVTAKMGELTTNGEKAVVASISNGGSVDITATNASVKAGSDGIAVTNDTGKTVTVTADNVTSSGDTGISIITDDNTGNKVTVTVGTEDYSADDGTVTGGVDLSNVQGGTVNITAWKIEGSFTNETACDAAINYIIRTAQDNITAQNDKGKDISTAKINEKIYIKPASGFEVVSAKNNDAVLDSDDTGFFYFLENHGGGIMLSAVLEKLPDPQPEPKPTPAPVFAPVTYKLKFDLDGGVLDGETELEMKCSAGQKITLPEAPTKEGFTFAGWQTEIRGKKVVFEAGEKFTVTAAKTFVALWVEE